MSSSATPHGSPLKLVLEDGSEYRGTGFGATTLIAGEVVFNTSMTGYIEALTDPSYRGQILVLTYPLIGNYGVPRPRGKRSLDRPYESARVQPQGLVVQCYSTHFSHHTAARALGAWLAADGIPGITGVDTRSLTRSLREHGTMRGWLIPADAHVEDVKSNCRAIDMEREIFFEVAPAEAVAYEGGPTRILLVDCGAKDHLVRSLLQRQASVVRVPWHADLERHAREADGILIGNGPGDPGRLGQLSDQVRQLMARFTGPIFGVCLGHQILAIAAGARTLKLTYGHRGVNQPVQEVQTRRCYVTSQNHGYAVDNRTVPADWEPWFINLNDGTNEGLRARSRPCMSVQFHPEGMPGPRDTAFLFDDFLRLASSLRRTS